MQLLERNPVRLAIIAMVNKMAKIISAVLTSGNLYRQSAG